MSQNDISERVAKSFDLCCKKGIFKNKGDMAEKINIDRTALSKVFRGDRDLTLDQLSLFVTLTQRFVNPNWILVGSGEMESNSLNIPFPNLYDKVSELEARTEKLEKELRERG